VLTRQEAVKIGLELAVSNRTHHDTMVSGSSPVGSATEGPFSDATLSFEKEDKKRLSVLPTLIVSFFILLLGSGAFAFMGLQPLPKEYKSFPILASVNISAIPEISTEKITISISTEPAAVDVLVGGKGLQKTPLFLVRPKGSAPLELTFRKAGFHDYMKTYEFDRQPDAPDVVKLVVDRPDIPIPRKTKTYRPKRAAKKAPAAQQKNEAAVAPSKGTDPVAISIPVPVPAAVPTPAPVPVATAEPGPAPAPAAATPVPSPAPQATRPIRRRLGKVKKLKGKTGGGLNSG
jgi:hypothetical protein